MNILIRLLEAKPKDNGKFFTDSKGKIHPLEPSPEATKYAQKMGFKHGWGGKKLDFAKIATKNILNDTLMGASSGAAMGYAVRKGKGAAIGAGLGALAGAIGGGAESAVKYKVLNKKTPKEQSRIISGVPYRAADVLYQGISSAIPALFIGGILRKSIAKKELLPLLSKYKTALKAGGKMARIATLKNAISGVRGKISGLEKLSVGAAVGQTILNTQDNVQGDLLPAKLYGSDNPGTVAHQTFYFTDKSAGTGLFSKKKYKYFGFGPEKTKK